ncbi:hypothetical protein AVEN_251935-1 [Araneus ventricosus]|uniref:DUF5641 domain-containing protein n=1 Tax=Araneus ventricosus TaxID=182803 RepID=A0A4Y2GXC0_ARAVE|nr:hypothetical protein AVEN_251935-1 [Araneus ventricosus]
MICGFIPRIENKEVLNELKRKKINFTDSFRNETEINLLIGADVLGKLLTGNTVELESGLTAVEMKLGWTVFGKGSYKKDNILTTLSMHSMNVPINKLWQLEVLGISSPTETKKEKGDLDLNDFNDKMKILPDGRYEVELPWKYDSKNLPSNKELVWKRHDRMINRFGKGEFFSDYQKVFRDWENLNIIERVPDFELNRECHYLSHRPVIKLDSQTTKLRPVFDASASQKGNPSLNECLFKGINLIELISDILDRFRMYPIGISGDIEQLHSRSLNKRIKYRSKLLKDLRQRFRKEYLGQLVQKHNEKRSRNPQVGEIVLVGDDNKKRLFWVFAKIVELIPGRDGRIRTVKLKTQHGTVLRPIQRIYPLEIYSNQSVDKGPGGEESNSHDVSDNKNELLSADDVIMRKYTSSGRYVRTPKRLDLLNNVCYVLETLSESQGGGEDVAKCNCHQAAKL